MEKLTDLKIYQLSSAIYSALPEGYDTTVTDGMRPSDTIKVTNDYSPIAMYISWDETAKGVLDAAVYDDTGDGDELIEDGIYWDTENGATVETIADGITKHI